MSMLNEFLGHSPRDLVEQTRHDQSPDMRRRRGTVAVSLLGIGAMAFTTMLQMGVVRRLPDPPIRKFNTKRVNLSDEAFSYSGPDSSIVILKHAINMVSRRPAAPTGHAIIRGFRSLQRRSRAPSRPWRQSTYSTRCPMWTRPTARTALLMP